jgi:guanine deaminase
MNRTILRGRALGYLSEPQGLGDAVRYRYLEDGAITIQHGRIVAGGDFVPDGTAEIIDHRPHLILPGFIDMHLPYVQVQMIKTRKECPAI